MARLKAEFDRWFRAVKKQRGLAQVHSSIFRLTCLLVEEGRADKDVLSVTRAAAKVIQRRPVPDRELISALDYAKHSEARVIQKWPPLNTALRGEIQQSATLQTLIDTSPCFPKEAGEALQTLFPGDPLLCLGEEVNRFKTGALSKWRGLDGGQFIVPNPMTATLGNTVDGRPSARTNSNTGPRTYQVVEFDFGTFDTHAAILLHLTQYAILRLAVYSGSKSLHGWFEVKGWVEANQRGFFERAVSLGADSKMWTPSQFTRLPLGTNKRTNNLQKVFYFCP